MVNFPSAGHVRNLAYVVGSAYSLIDETNICGIECVRHNSQLP